MKTLKLLLSIAATCICFEVSAQTITVNPSPACYGNPVTVTVDKYPPNCYYEFLDTRLVTPVLLAGISQQNFVTFNTTNYAYEVTVNVWGENLNFIGQQKIYFQVQNCGYTNCENCTKSIETTTIDNLEFNNEYLWLKKILE